MNNSYIYLGVALVVALFVLPGVMYFLQNSRYGGGSVLGTAFVVCVFIALALLEAYNKI
jgi:hypothetical protein